MIKNIIFDLGAVLLDISFEKTSNAFKKLGVKNFDAMYSQNAANDLFESMETGHIQDEVFLQELKKHCDDKVMLTEVETAWNTILINFRSSSIEHLTQLKNKYNLYLLSNTNHIHYKEFSKMFQNNFEGKKLESCFTKSYFSHQMQLRKPYPSTYEFVLNDAGIDKNETLFIDDSVANIEGAKKAGLHTRLLLQNERIESIGL